MHKIAIHFPHFSRYTRSCAFALRPSITRMVLCLTLMSALTPSAFASQTLPPESREVVCQPYENEALKRCNLLYENAAQGHSIAFEQIGIAIQNQPLPDTTDWLLYNFNDISRHERAVRWFRSARELGSLEANYWIARTIHSAFGTAATTPPSEEERYDRGLLLKSALKVGSPAEAFLAASECSASPGCMRMLGEFYERGFGTSASEPLAAEWYAKSALTFSEIGNRDEAIKLLEILSTRYPTYPYTNDVVRRLFPHPQEKQDKSPKSEAESI